jgi:hypothetical protein
VLRHLRSLLFSDCLLLLRWKSTLGKAPSWILYILLGSVFSRRPTSGPAASPLFLCSIVEERNGRL